MRKLINRIITMLFLLVPLVAGAQTTVTGRIVNEKDGTPLENATVIVKGKATGAKTDANGNFSITAVKGDVLIITSVNYTSKEVKLKDATTIVVRMQLTEGTLDEVIVVAMDRKLNPKELSFSTQNASGKELQETQRESFVNALQGRVAGLTVNQTGGAAGASSQIVLRGFNSLSLDNSPLFIIDGVIADNSTLNETSNGGSALGLASDRPNRGNDYSNRISDINPNDIESITILKGPEATALYGSQASSGAIVITTKKAKATGKPNINYDNSFRIQNQSRLPQNISAFAGGTNGVKADLFAAFGPSYRSLGIKTYDNLNNFFRKGFSQTHNLSVSYGKKNVSFIVSGSVFDQESPIPTNTYRRYNLRLANTTKISKYIEITPSISYINTVNDKPLRGASGYLLNLLVWPADNDIRDWQVGDGLKKPLFNSNPNADLDNPFYNVYKNRSSDKNDRWLATFGININPTKWLAISGRFGYDTYQNDGYTRYDSMSFYLTRAQKGQQDNYYRTYYGYNHTVTATAKKSIKDFNGRIMVGNMWQDYEFQQWAVVGNNLASLNRSDSNNTDPATRIRLSNAAKGLPNYNIRRSMAYFGEVALNWKSAIFITYSYRFEESSIFPKFSRKYNYPAGGMSIIVSDLIPGIKGNILSYWKLRGSLASTARSSQPYANQSVLDPRLSSGGGFSYGFTNNNPLLEPEKQSTYEIGTDLRFKNNRFSIDATYYNTKNKNLIVEQFRASYGTGFVLNTLNVGANQNQGVELALNLDLIKSKNFGWNSRLNFNKMWNKVLELPANVPEFYQSDTWLYANARGGLVVGGATTTITSYGYQRNNNGDILISPLTGLPVLDNNFRVRGDRNPDFTLGFVNNFTYKKLRLSFLWDLKMGGDIFNATERYLTTQGRSLRTLDRLVPRVINGILQDGLENTSTPTKNNISITPYYNQAYYTTMPEEEFIEKDINWLRLRDISLSYNFLNKKTKYLSSLNGFVTINDLILISNYTGTDPQVNGNTSGSRGVGAFGFDYGNLGTPISINFGIKAAL